MLGWFTHELPWWQTHTVLRGAHRREKQVLFHWERCNVAPVFASAGERICSDVLALLPRDLKRDVSKKLEKLEKRTQRAIAELIRALRCRRDGVWGHQGLHDPYWELSALLLGEGGTW